MKFGISDILTREDTPNDKSQLHAETFLAMHNEKIESIKNLSGRLPDENEIFFIWTIKSFNAFTFIPYLYKVAGIIDELVITTYAMNSRIADALCKLMDAGKVKRVSLFISETLKFRNPGVVDYLDSIKSKRDNLEVYYEWVHAKVSLIKVEENHYVVEGSGNWGENARHEQYIFLKSKSVYEFRKQWIYSAIRKGTD